MISDVKGLALWGYFASISRKIKHCEELSESATSNLSVLDKILVCIAGGFNFANEHFPKCSSELIFAKGSQKLAKSRNFIHAKIYARKVFKCMGDSI